MGWVALSTLLVVQSCLDEKDLGVATSSNQFARTLGGAVGVGICGSFIAARFSNLFESVRTSDLMRYLPVEMSEAGFGQVESLLHPEAQATMPDAPYGSRRSYGRRKRCILDGDSGCWLLHSALPAYSGRKGKIKIVEYGLN
jgi:hypothetical protein